MGKTIWFRVLVGALIGIGASVLYLTTRPHRIPVIDRMQEKLPDLDVPPITR